MSKPKLGYIGLGAIGTPMCLQLVRAGYAMTVWGRTAARLKPATDAGAAVASSPAELAHAVDVLFLCVTDTDAVEGLVFGPDGIVRGGAAGKLLVDNSTIHPVRCRDMSARLRAETGMGWVDAPVSGGVGGAEQGTLAVMAGGEAEDVARAAAIMQGTFAARVTHMGPAGAGQATKICNQMILGATVAVVAEAMNMAAAFGVAAARLPDALKGGYADSTVLQNHGRRMAAANYGTPSGSNLMLKDMNIATDLARATGSPIPVGGLTAELYRMADVQGHGPKGQIGLMALYRDKPV